MEDLELNAFNQGDYQRAAEQENLAETICKVLYPCDEHYAGKELRLKQQYFFVSATVQRAVERYICLLYTSLFTRENLPFLDNWCFCGQNT